MQRSRRWLEGQIAPFLPCVGRGRPQPRHSVRLPWSWSHRTARTVVITLAAPHARWARGGHVVLPGRRRVFVGAGAGGAVASVLGHRFSRAPGLAAPESVNTPSRSWKGCGPFLSGRCGLSRVHRRLGIPAGVPQAGPFHAHMEIRTGSASWARRPEGTPEATSVLRLFPPSMSSREAGDPTQGEGGAGTLGQQAGAGVTSPHHHKVSQ